MVVPELNAKENYCFSKILRLGTSSPSLGPLGWQVADYEWRLEAQTIEGDFGIIFPPDVVCHMVPLYNYVIKIKLSVDDCYHDCVVHWRGVPGFRKEDAGTYLDPSDSFGVHQPIIRAPVWPQPQPILPAEALRTPISPATPLDSGTSSGEDLQSNSAVERFIERKKITCPNPSCSQVIMSTFKNCPYCKMPIASV